MANITASSGNVSGSGTPLTEFTEFKVKHVINMYIVPIQLFIGVFGNTISFIILRKKAFQSPPSNFFLFSLSILDNLSLILRCMWAWIRELTKDKINLVLTLKCGGLAFPLFVANKMEAYTVVLLSIDRFIHVFYPTKAKGICTVKKGVLAFLFTFLIIVGYEQHLFWTLNVDSSSPVRFMGFCPSTIGMEEWVGGPLGWVNLSLYGLVPFFAIFSINLAITLKLRQQRRKIAALSRKKNPPKWQHVMLPLISLVFMVCIPPVVIYSIATPFWYNGTTHHFAISLMLRAIVDAINNVNYCVNFLLYFVSAQWFRDEFKRTFACKKIQSRNNTTTRSLDS